MVALLHAFCGVAVSGLDQPGAAIDVHQVVPVYIGLAYYLVGLGDFRDAPDDAPPPPLLPLYSDVGFGRAPQ